MDYTRILASADHTLLKPEATWPQIQKLCDEAIEYHCASVCIPPAFVKRAYEYTAGKLNICTVIGFPNGNTTTSVKVYETREAIANGANEIDMVAPIWLLKDGQLDAVTEEIRAVKAACGDHVLKVIIETCLLTESEKIQMCKAVSAAGADYIKTSTGFSSGGATREDVALLRANVEPEVKVKAAGGISTLQDAEDFLALGADRLGTSRIVGLVKSQL